MTASSGNPASAARVLKEEPGTLVELVGDGLDAAVHKTYRNRGTRLLQTFLRASRARREHDNLRHVHRAGLPCTEPVRWSEVRTMGCVRQSMLVTRFVPDCRPLKSVLRELAPGAARNRLIEAMGTLLAALHRTDLLWGTPMPRNFLLQGSPRDGHLLLCDLPAAFRTGRPLHGSTTACIDLFEAAFSASRRSDFSAAERLRYLRGYCAGDRAMARRLWSILRRRSRTGNDLRKAVRRLFGLYLRR